MKNLLKANLLIAPIVIVILANNIILLFPVALYILLLHDSKKVRKIFNNAYKESELLTNKILKL